MQSRAVRRGGGGGGVNNHAVVKFDWEKIILAMASSGSISRMVIFVLAILIMKAPTAAPFTLFAINSPICVQSNGPSQRGISGFSKLAGSLRRRTCSLQGHDKSAIDQGAVVCDRHFVVLCHDVSQLVSFVLSFKPKIHLQIGSPCLGG